MLDPKRCAPGREQWEEFTSRSSVDVSKTVTRVQYDYRAPDGELFSCVANTLEDARERRKQWENRR